MYRIVLIMTFILSPFSFASNECFYDQKSAILIQRDGDSKVTFKVKGKEGADGVFFCFKEDKDLVCQGDDDSGRFILAKDHLIFKSEVVLGSPDEPHHLSVEASDKRDILSSCD